MEKNTLTYLAADRLGELCGLTAAVLSPMGDLSAAVRGLKAAMPGTWREEQDALLIRQGLLTETEKGLRPAPRLEPLVRALYSPQRCFRMRMQEGENGCDTYFVAIEGAWVRVDAHRGWLTVSEPLTWTALEPYLQGCIELALRQTELRLQLERREAGCVHGAVIGLGEKGYSFIGTVFAPADRTPRLFSHVFAPTAENRRWIAAMLLGEREFILPPEETADDIAAPETEPAEEKRSYKKALRGFLIAAAVNLCAAVILAVLRHVL